LIKKTGKWTKEEDEILEKIVSTIGQKSWKKVAEFVPGRTAIQCLHRWTKILKPGLIKGPWTLEQDKKLLEWVDREGPNQWSLCAEYIKGRSGKQCRERWYNTLNPNVKKGNWSPEEDFIIFESYRQMGSQWTKIAAKIPGRTENSIKNRFYSTLRRICSQHKNASNTDEKVSSALIPKDRLIEYVNDAILEKTLNFVQYKKEMNMDFDFNLKDELNNQDESTKINTKQSSNNNLFNISNLIENLQAENTLNNQNAMYNNYNNNNNLAYIIGNDDNNNNFNQTTNEYNKYKDLPIETIEKNIDNLCEANPFNDINATMLDNQINEFIENFFQNNGYENEANLLCIGCSDNNKQQPQQQINNSSTQLIQEKANIINNNINNLKGKEDSKVLNSLLDQLNDLELLLQNTKSELLNKSKAINISSNLTTSTDNTIKK